MSKNLEEKDNDIIPQLLPIEKSHHQQMNSIKTNIVKMFKNRGFINEENEEKYIKKITSDENDDNEYILNLDNDTNYNTNIPNKKVYIKISDNKNTSITKNSPIGEFLTKHHAEYKLIIVESMNQKSEKIIASYETPCEIFKITELMINIIEHILVPKHIVLSQEEGQLVLEAYCAKKKDMPLILTTDPVARYYNMQPGEICKIIRSSVMTCETPFYRIVVKSKIMKAKT
jgi:DNA-directed RNA polymerase I, II, and III subunit RPABC1